jgi:sterol desaturase/sphingolipid hydroxylase (fatty acid hydroxylase superfamily)
MAVRRQHAGILLLEVHANHHSPSAKKPWLSTESSHGSRLQTAPLSSVKFAHFAPDFANFRK